MSVGGAREERGSFCSYKPRLGRGVLGAAKRLGRGWAPQGPGGGSRAPSAIQGVGVRCARGWSTDPEAWRAGAGRAARPEGGREGETSVRESSGVEPSTELSAIMVTSYIHPVQYGNHSSCAAAEYLTCGQWTEQLNF